MIEYKVGSEFPFPNKSNGQEMALVSMNEAFFDVLYYINDASESDINTFRRGSMQYACFSESAIPFPIFKFPKSKWSFDVNINIFKVQEDKVEDWLNSESNIINLYLIDAQTNTLLAMRMIGTRTEYAEGIRDILDNQLEKYENKEQVDFMLQSILSAFPTEDMLAKTLRLMS
jgi:hypothetical protein